MGTIRYEVSERTATITLARPDQLNALSPEMIQELRQAYEGKAGRSPEELEAMRQLLDERRLAATRVTLSLVSAVVMGLLGAGCAWFYYGSDAITFLTGLVFAVLWIMMFSMVTSLLIGAGCCVVIVAASSLSDLVDMLLDARLGIV